MTRIRTDFHKTVVGEFKVYASHCSRLGVGLKEFSGLYQSCWDSTVGCTVLAATTPLRMRNEAIWSIFQNAKSASKKPMELSIFN